MSPAGSKLAKSELAVGQGKGKVVLQTFEKSSLELLEKEMPQVPKILLLWVGEGSIEPKSKVTFAESGDKDKATLLRQAATEGQSRIPALGRVRQGPGRDRHRPVCQR